MKIGIVAPEKYRRYFALSSLTLSLKESFDAAALTYLEVNQLKSFSSLKSFDLIIFPSSHGNDTPYKYFLDRDDIRSAVNEYAHQGAVAGFCSGAYTLTQSFKFFAQDQTIDYNGYIPLCDVEGEGPYDYLDGAPLDERMEKTRIKPVSFEQGGQRHHVNLCYHHGPAYLNPAHSSNPRDIKSFADFSPAHSAILGLRKEKGIVLLFGALPEIQPSHVPENCSIEHLLSLRNAMMETEGAHKILWKKCLLALEKKSLMP